MLRFRFALVVQRDTRQQASKPAVVAISCCLPCFAHALFSPLLSISAAVAVAKMPLIADNCWWIWCSLTCSFFALTSKKRYTKPEDLKCDLIFKEWNKNIEFEALHVHHLLEWSLSQISHYFHSMKTSKLSVVVGQKWPSLTHTLSIWFTDPVHCLETEKLALYGCGQKRNNLQWWKQHKRK